MFFAPQVVSAPSEAALTTVRGLRGFDTAGGAAVAGNVAGSFLVEQVTPTVTDGDVREFGYAVPRTRRTLDRGRLAAFPDLRPCTPTGRPAPYGGHQRGSHMTRPANPTKR
jgi:hypothetical protein